MAKDGREGSRNKAKHAKDNSPGPWTKWTETDPAERCIRFIQTYCRAPKGIGFGKPLVLSDWQKAWIRQVFAKGVLAAVMQLPRGNGKSTLAAAIAVWALFDITDSGSPQIPIVATTVGQAMRSVYSVAVSMVAAEPELESRSIKYSAIGNSRIYVPATEGEMFPISADVDGLQGLDPTLAVCDEVGFIPIETWDSLLLASGKRPTSLVFGLGTPGLDRNNALFHLRSLVQEGAVLPGFVFKEYSAPVGCEVSDRKAWRQANPALDAGYLQESALETALTLSPEGHFRVFRLAQWVDGIESWLGADGRSVWQALEDRYDFVLKGGTWVGVDVGIKRDSTAVVAVQKRPDGRLHGIAKVWIPTDETPVDVTDVMQYIRELAEKYQLGAVSYDPRFFDVPAKMLFDAGIPMVEIPQSVERMTAVIGGLYELIRGGGVSHDGDPVFETQVLNAVPRFNERGFTLAKGKSRGRIDAAIAFGLAVDRAQHPGKPRAPLAVA